MALIALLDGPDAALAGRLAGGAGRHTFVRAPTEAGFLRLVRERPVSLALVDLSSVDPRPVAPTVLDRLRTDFPRLPFVVGIGRSPDPGLLLHLGRHPCPVVTAAELDCPAAFEAVVRAQLSRGPQRIPARLRGVAPPWSLAVIRRAIDVIDECWSADELARDHGMRRQELNLRLRDVGLPTAGRLLTWVRVFYAAWWLSDPGRSGVSVARQLEYSSSQALVRVVRNLLRITPGELVVRGGLDWAWLRFLQGHPGLVRSDRAAAYVATPARWSVETAGRGRGTVAAPGAGLAALGRPEPLYSDWAEPTTARIA